MAMLERTNRVLQSGRAREDLLLPVVIPGMQEGPGAVLVPGNLVPPRPGRARGAEPPQDVLVAIWVHESAAGIVRDREPSFQVPHMPFPLHGEGSAQAMRLMPAWQGPLGTLRGQGILQRRPRTREEAARLERPIGKGKGRGKDTAGMRREARALDAELEAYGEGKGKKGRGKGKGKAAEDGTAALDAQLEEYRRR